MNTYTLISGETKIEIPLDSLTSQLQRQGLEVFLPHEFEYLRQKDRINSRLDELYGIIKHINERRELLNNMITYLMETKKPA